MSKPYKEQINNGIKYREFDPMVESDELVWHRDRETRIVTVLEGEGWMFQMDNEIPKEMKPGDILEVKKMEYHRLYKAGTTPLKISIKEKYMKTFKEFNEAKRMKYATVIKKLKDGEWDTSMDVKQRMHLTYTDNNTGKTQVVFVEATELEESATAQRKLKTSNKLSSAEYEKFSKLKAFNDKDWKWNSKEGLYHRVKESTDLEEAKKVIAQVELWNGKKIKKSFKDQSSAEKFIKNLQDTEDVRGYNMYAEGLEEAPTDKYMMKDISMALRSAGIGTANVIKVRKLFKGSTADDSYTMKDINLALMSVIGPANIKKVIKALRGRAVKESTDLEEAYDAIHNMNSTKIN